MDSSHDLVVRTIREHAGALLRTARRHSLCADDAHDAYQRALEIFLRRASSLEPATVDRWLHVVVKHEAQAVRRSRQQLVAADEVDLDGRPAEAQPDVDERLMRFDRLSRSAEALQRLKPQEVTALWLKAQGLSYAEIAERQSWTYTKVNRCITEGRRAFLERYAGIEAGDECRRWSPVLSALIDGEASAEQMAAARPHLRRCSACKATLRELHAAGPRMAGVLPGPGPGLVGAGMAGAGAVASAGGGLGSGRFDSFLRGAESAAATLQERFGAWAVKAQMAGEVATGGKAAAVAASAAALAGGGAMTIHSVRDARPVAASSAPADPGPREGSAGVAGGAARVVALRSRTGAVVGLRTGPGAAGSPGGRAQGTGGGPGRSPSARANEFGGRAPRTSGRGVSEFRAPRARASVSEFRAARSAGRAAGVSEFRTAGMPRALSTTTSSAAGASPRPSSMSSTSTGGSSSTSGAEFSPATVGAAGSPVVEGGTRGAGGSRTGEFGG
ncbi:zf-HC2 domain-containing protein [Capillimicrobium parvum]|uniref:Putative zinc-finger domain-containing protein n=1 Tax=Capillimicrobium parvum TaxID=2884022 RepID=A0A9E6Y093_9ACTN|nr:sigma-70 family RNA polymerase sigma factor [Capillimicrobium parvum]UGS37787.1 hypothetical protein DSM104329_04208 [Capillimicrobium parvum]